MSIPLAVAAAHEGTVELEDVIVSLTDKLAKKVEVKPQMSTPSRVTLPATYRSPS
jgi:hypothetical protein